MQPEIPAELHNAIPTDLIAKHHYLCQSTNMNISTIDAHRSKVKRILSVFFRCACLQQTSHASTGCHITVGFSTI